LLLKTANSRSFLVDISSDSEEALFAPVRTPGVLQDPVVLSTFATIADYENAMVEVSSTTLAADNTLAVRLEYLGIGFNCDRNWLLGYSSHKLFWIVYFDVLETRDLNFALCFL